MFLLKLIFATTNLLPLSSAFDGGFCVANNQMDQHSVDICNSVRNDQSGCRAQYLFCHWQN